MSEKENIGSFVKQNSRLVREWLEAKIEVNKLLAIRYIAKAAGHLIWIVIALFLIFLLFIFGGLTAGFWLSSITGSYTAGFGIVTAFGFLVLLPLAGLCKKFIINAVIRALAVHDKNEADNDQHKDND